MQWHEALVLSVSSFHGRGFFPQGINLGDSVTILAATKAVVGLVIEISLIATCMNPCSRPDGSLAEAVQSADASSGA